MPSENSILSLYIGSHVAAERYDGPYVLRACFDFLYNFISCHPFTSVSDSALVVALPSFLYGLLRGKYQMRLVYLSAGF